MDACAARVLTDETLASRYHYELEAFVKACFAAVEREARDGRSRVAINLNKELPLQIAVRKLRQYGYQLEQINGQLIIKW